MKYDFLIVGTGFFGATFARLAAESGKKCLLIDKRNHIGGNCYTEKVEGINVHKYGPHVFHTNNDKVWNFINRFSKFNSYQHRVKVKYKEKIYSFPINLMTANQVWGIKTPEEFDNKIKEVTKTQNSDNLENWALSNVGKELYSIFIEGYTSKQWNTHPKNLPSSIIKRIPLRNTFDDRYFNDSYQGIPIDGYTKIFENMLDHKNIDFKINVDFFENRHELQTIANKTVYTGKIDEFYDYRFGELEYRSLIFDHKILEGDYQGCSIVNYTDANVKHTRIVEHKHFEFLSSKKTVVTWEYPDNYSVGKTPYYPINNEKNNSLYEKYKSLNSEIIFGGRLGTYRYMDMHQIIASAMKAFNKL